LSSTLDPDLFMDLQSFGFNSVVARIYFFLLRFDIFWGHDD
jgi:hypothetical protein